VTRYDDRFISLKNRVTVARDKNADLFMAIHADTVGAGCCDHRAIVGIGCQRKPGKQENRADIIGGLDLGARPRNHRHSVDLVRSRTTPCSFQEGRDPFETLDIPAAPALGRLHGAS
jgi:N-acetylmuramoyl-L-alanine amidase